MTSLLHRWLTRRFKRTFREDVRGGPGVRVDRRAGIIYGVKVLGKRSKNGRVYLPEAIRRAVRLYEGIPVNIDHPNDPDDSRSFRDRFGKLVNVRIDEGGEMWADLKFNREHKEADSICEAARSMPDTFGLSHNAEGECEERDGITYVREIRDVRSVDIVADPASTNGLFESRRGRARGRTKRRTMFEKRGELRRFIESLAARAKTRGLRTLSKQLREYAREGDGYDMEAESADSGGSKSQAQGYKAHLLKGVESLIDSEDPEDHARIRKMMDLCKPGGKKMEESEEDDRGEPKGYRGSGENDDEDEDEDEERKHVPEEEGEYGDDPDEELTGKRHADRWEREAGDDDGFEQGRHEYADEPDFRDEDDEDEGGAKQDEKFGYRTPRRDPREKGKVRGAQEARNRRGKAKGKSLLEQENLRLKKREYARSLCESQKIQPDKTLVRILERCSSPKEMREVLSREKTRSRRPRSGTGDDLLEADRWGRSQPSDVAGQINMLRGIN